MNKSDGLGDRMKDYEAREAARRFIPLLPVYARIDGRSFSRFTKGLPRPFDSRIASAMTETTRFLVAETHARIGYTQSDEINLVWLAERYDSELFFGGKVQKIVSVLAGMASARFNGLCMMDDELRGRADRLVPAFDCRAFQLPSRTEAANAFLWREKDAAKNAVSMAARAYYGSAEMHGKSGSEMQEMLWQKGVNFDHYPARFKRGVFLRRRLVERDLPADVVERIPEKFRPALGAKVERSEVVEIEMPIFGKVTNREAVIFDGAEPELECTA